MSLTALALLSATAGLNGCATQRAKNEAQYNTRAKALALIDEGKKLEQDGSAELALDRYNRSAAISPSADAFFRMGRIYEARGENEKAGAAYQEALREAPDLHEARMALLALGYQPPDGPPKPGEVDAAKVWAAQARSALPVVKGGGTATAANQAATTGTQPVAAAADATSQTATTETAEDDTETSAPQTADDLKAEREQALAEAAEKRMPTEAEVQSVLFGGKTEQGKLPSATQPTYGTDQDIILGTYTYHFNKAEQLRRLQKYEQAASEYEQAMQADPKQIDARLNLGDMLMKLERFQRARLYYEQAATTFPDAPQPLLKLGNYHMARKQPDRARQFYQQALQKDPKFVEAINNLAVLDMQDKDYKEAAEFLDRVLKLDPNYQNAWLNRGIIASEVEKNPELARTCFQRYIELQGSRAAEVRNWISEIQGKPAK